MSKNKKGAAPAEPVEVPPTPALPFDELRRIYDEIFEQFPTPVGKAISKREREETRSFQSRLTYGEIDFDSFAIVFDKLKNVYGKPCVGDSGEKGMLQGRGGRFYDLGCGTGKPLIAAALLHEFDSCTGIEVLEGLTTAAREIVRIYDTKGRTALGRPIPTTVEVFHGDFLNLRLRDWRDADVVFANSTCFDDVLMSEIAKIGEGLKKGAFVITFTKRIPSAEFTVVERELYQMSWGGATVFIHQKNTEARLEPIRAEPVAA